VAREDVERYEPALTLDSVERRVPFHGFAHSGSTAHDERVEALSYVALPARHRGDVSLHRSVAVRLRDLRIATRKEDEVFAFSRLDRLRCASCFHKAVRAVRPEIFVEIAR